MIVNCFTPSSGIVILFNCFTPCSIIIGRDVMLGVCRLHSKVILGNFVLKIYSESSSAQVTESFMAVNPTTEVSWFWFKSCREKMSPSSTWQQGRLFQVVQREVILVETSCLASADYKVKSFWKILSSKFMQNLIQDKSQNLLWLSYRQRRYLGSHWKTVGKRSFFCGA